MKEATVTNIVDYTDILFTSDVNYIRENLTNLLNTGICQVEFTKADGSLREMRCTRSFEVIKSVAEESQLPTGDFDAKSGTTAIRVFDLDILAWRSFNVSRLSKFTVEV